MSNTLDFWLMLIAASTVFGFFSALGAWCFGKLAR